MPSVRFLMPGLAGGRFEPRADRTDERAVRDRRLNLARPALANAVDSVPGFGPMPMGLTGRFPASLTLHQILFHADSAGQRPVHAGRRQRPAGVDLQPQRLGHPVQEPPCGQAWRLTTATA